jgi:hypothetical protein
MSIPCTSILQWVGNYTQVTYSPWATPPTLTIINTGDPDIDTDVDVDVDVDTDVVTDTDTDTDVDVDVDIDVDVDVDFGVVVDVDIDVDIDADTDVVTDTDTDTDVVTDTDTDTDVVTDTDTDVDPDVPDSGEAQVLLSGVPINNWSFNPATCQLSWPETGNMSTATLTFSQNSNHQQSFTGTLELILPPPASPVSGTYSGVS